MKDKSIEKLASQLSNSTVVEEEEENKAIIYIRCSTKSQNNEDNNMHGHITQREDCLEYAQRNNFEVLETIEETRRANDLTKLKIYNIHKTYPDIQHLIVADSSRLSRNYAEGARFVNECEKAHIIIHSAREDVSSDTTNGKKTILNSLVNASEESRVFSLRIRSNIRQKRIHGSKFGCAKYGHEMYKSKVVKKNGVEYPIMKLRKNDHEQKMIELIKIMYFGSTIVHFNRVIRDLLNNPKYKLTGFNKILYGYFSAKDIANRLNELNLSKRGRLWSNASVRGIITFIKDLSVEKKESIVFRNEDGLYFQNFYNEDDIVFKSFDDFPELEHFYVESEYNFTQISEEESDSEEENDSEEEEEMDESEEDSKILYIKSLKNDYYGSEF
jgi:DNA invertase Pin-like site-specific DNA recombinase